MGIEHHKHSIECRPDRFTVSSLLFVAVMPTEQHPSALVLLRWAFDAAAAAVVITSIGGERHLAFALVPTVPIGQALDDFLRPN